ncbi:MAG TPA: caspase family protein [Thermoanaerobaculia bacterium]|nr:caspase family protein [Thermoanaerobaculia bacterium]
MSVLVALLLLATPAGAATRRALLIGINDYSLSTEGWPNLSGTLNDVKTLQEMLVGLYGFQQRDIVTITDKRATRTAIVKAIEDLAAKSGKGDVVFFYYAGHGSQIVNTKSDEPDQRDETIVPADSRVDARDIRDKELRPLFNRILDRGARLTIVLDACHSASGARAYAQSRGVRPDLRDLADGKSYGPRPEDRGALVLAATQDSAEAWETTDDRGKRRGVFTWALINALRDAAPGEPAEDTFLRAKARVYVDRAYQEPVLAGNASARRAPFLGTRTDHRGGQTVVGVSRVRGRIATLQGGWANGLAPGTKLRGPGEARLTVVEVKDFARSEARIDAGQVASGALLEVTAFTAAPGRKLRVWVPAGIAVAEDVEVVRDRAGADYVLHINKGQFAWVRPDASLDDARRSGLPVRTKWTNKNTTLTDDLRKLQKIHGWLTLQSPPGAYYPYRLDLPSRVKGGERYMLRLRTAAKHAPQRYLYLFSIDSDGRSVLLFPKSSVENYFPLVKGTAPAEIPLGVTLEIVPPWGIDTYYLLSTTELLPNPAVLEWDGVRAGRANWSIDKLIVEAVSP